MEISFFHSLIISEGTTQLVMMVIRCREEREEEDNVSVFLLLEDRLDFEERLLILWTLEGLESGDGVCAL